MRCSHHAALWPDRRHLKHRIGSLQELAQWSVARQTKHRPVVCFLNSASAWRVGTCLPLVLVE